MPSRCIIAPEIGAFGPPTPRAVDTLPDRSFARPPVFRCDGRAAGTAQDAAGEKREIDARLYLFTLCEELQAVCLDRRNIDCLLDAEGVGRLSDVVCHMLGLIVRELVECATARARPQTPANTVTVTLRRREATCLCTVSCPGFAFPDRDVALGLERVQRFAAEFGGGWMVRCIPDRRLAAIMFDAHAAEHGAPAAIRRSSIDDAWSRSVAQSLGLGARHGS
jgi:hypothetical protein